MIDFEELCSRAYEIKAAGEIFKVRKLNIDEIHANKDGDNALQNAKKLTCDVSIDPKLTIEKIGRMPYDAWKDLQDGIMDLNGLSIKSKEAIQGNSTVTPADSSSLKSPDGLESTSAK
jgi:hypothetical protein